jgi:hypothetical protein
MEENECTICGEAFNNDKFILKCKHFYHYQCLIDSLKSKKATKVIKPSERCCPLCRCRIPLIPYKESYGQHIPYIHTPSHNSSQSANICLGVCKNGQQCKFKGKYNGYCGHHKIS